MQVLMLIQLYHLEKYQKFYFDIYGNPCDCLPLDQLMYMQVKSVFIHYPSHTVDITLVKF